MMGQAEAWAIEADGRPVGAVTSAVYSPDLDKNIAMAMVDIEYATTGNQLVLDMGDNRVDVSITNLPFIDNREKVWRGVKSI